MMKVNDDKAKKMQKQFENTFKRVQEGQEAIIKFFKLKLEDYEKK